MICYRCGNRFEDGVGICPVCSAPAAMPVIPDTAFEESTEAGAPVPDITVKAVIPETAPIIQPAPVPAPQEQPQGEQQPEPPAPVQKDRRDTIIKVLSLALAVMTVLCIFLALRGGDDEDGGLFGYKTGKSSKENNELLQANELAAQVYDAAIAVNTFLEVNGAPINSGVVCSSDDVGKTVADTLDAYYSADYVKNAIEKRLDDDAKGTTWAVVFESGMPTAVYAAKDCETNYIGSYPKAAKKKCTNSFSDRNDDLFLYSGGSDISADELFWKN